MDTGTLMLIIGIVLAAIGIIALFSAYRLRISSLLESQDQKTQLAVRTSQVNDIQNRLELTQSEFENALENYEQLKTTTSMITGSLKTLGLLHPDADPLALTQADIMVEAKSKTRSIIPPQTTGEVFIPAVPGFTTTQELREALLLAGKRTDARKNRPFSRRYMVDDGPLTRTQLENLISVFLDHEYLTLKGDKFPVPHLTSRGQRLLNKVITGEL